MLPKSYGLHPFQSQHTAQYTTSGRFGTQPPRRRVQHNAEPNEVQLLEKPVLRRPEPPKPPQETDKQPDKQSTASGKSSGSGRRSSQEGTSNGRSQQQSGRQNRQHRNRNKSGEGQDRQDEGQGQAGRRAGDNRGRQHSQVQQPKVSNRQQTALKSSEDRSDDAAQASAPAAEMPPTQQVSEAQPLAQSKPPPKAQEEARPPAADFPTAGLGLIAKPSRPSMPVQQSANRGASPRQSIQLRRQHSRQESHTSSPPPAQPAMASQQDSRGEPTDGVAEEVKDAESLHSEHSPDVSPPDAAPPAEPAKQVKASQNGAVPSTPPQERVLDRLDASSNGAQLVDGGKQSPEEADKLREQSKDQQGEEDQATQAAHEVASLDERPQIPSIDRSADVSSQAESQPSIEEAEVDELRAPQLPRRPPSRTTTQIFDRSRSYRKTNQQQTSPTAPVAGHSQDSTGSGGMSLSMDEDEEVNNLSEDIEEGEEAATSEEDATAVETGVLASTSDVDENAQASLMAKPTRRDGVPAQPTNRVLRRLPSDRRSAILEAEKVESKDSKPRQNKVSRENVQKEEEGSASKPQSASKNGRKKRQVSRTKYEKPDIEKLRQSRYERRQQRQERNEAEAPEQEEIFEVGAEGMLVQDLAEKLACNSGDVLKTLFLKGIMAQVNQVLDKDMVKAVAEDYGVEVLDLEEAGLDTMAQKRARSEDEDEDLLVPRPPVVTVMGHVDHGKTSLLDFIRKTKVAAGEAGGITQAIGAYTCQVESGEGERQITFIDTPGHEAFTAMRARGAKVTDVAIIVVACDDGVRPQTKEAIGHAKAAKVPIIVALNKVDKEGANPEKAKQEISEAGLLPEEWGGDTPMVEISAKKGMGIDDLLETILLVAELEQLSANPSRAAAGTVVEANMHPRMGPVATLLVAAGTLKTGDVFHAGAAYGKVRLIKDSANKTLEEAGPSVAVQVVGLNSVPVAGDEFTVMGTEQEARKVAAAIEEAQRQARLSEQAGGTMVTGVSFATADPDESEGLQHFNIILKADASGSLEAVKSALLTLPQDRVTLRFLLTAAGPVNAGDVQLAAASQGHIVSFNLEPSESVIAQSKRLGVAMKSYKVIYELIDEVRALMEGRLSTVEERTPLGEAEVRAVFGSGSRRVAGCMVTEGLLRKGCFVAVKRNKKQVHEGELTSLRRVKENVSEISQGNECGVGVANFIEWREGDKIEAVEVRFKRQTLEEASQRELTSNLQSWDEEEEMETAAVR